MLTTLRYHLQHAALLGATTAIAAGASAAMGHRRRKHAPAVVRELRARVRTLMQADLANATAGAYPAAQLFDVPVAGYARTLPTLLRDLGAIDRRRAARAFKVLPTDLPAGDLAALPPYYRRTFHWQTDGYLSDHSAAIYDLGVELLFGGMADVMRRQIVAPVSTWRAAHPGADVRVLDVACGTGAATRQLMTAHPDLRIQAIDLSAPYAAAAQRRLGPTATVDVGNAEALPYADGSFDVVTCVYLFHELPRKVRRRVGSELRRVLRPDGLLVVEDSAQLIESSAIEPALRAFAEDFHEPFYADYLEDPLEDLLREVGFTVTSSQPHLVAKVVVGRPGPTA